MSVPHYERMRPFAWAWISEIPEHWTTPPLSARYVFDLGKMLDEKRETGRYATPYLRNVNVQWDTFNLESVHTMDIAPHEEVRYLLRPGDVLICEGGEVGRAAIWNGEIERCAYQKALHRARPIGEEDPRFLYYSLRACFDQGVFEAGGNPNTILHLTGEQLRAYRLPCPPADEQREISAFLDRETATIDGLIAEQERLIALLQEKRQAVISHAVTNGPKAEASMTNTGQSWLPRIPSQWELRPLKSLITTIEQGWSPQCEAAPAVPPNEWGVLKVGCVNGGQFRPEENKRLPDDQQPDSSLGIQKDDLLISRANTPDLVGSAAVADTDYPRLLLCDKLYRVRFHQSLAVPHFVAHYLSTRLVRSHIAQNATGASASMVNISQSLLLDLPVPVPPLHEQREIVEVLASSLSTLTRLTTDAENAERLLRERRTALITAAVTGQIDVRALASAA